MAKSEYRGQDVVREMISDRVGKSKDTILTSGDDALWNTTCDQLADEMENDGLISTAQTIREYKLTL